MRAPFDKIEDAYQRRCAGAVAGAPPLLPMLRRLCLSSTQPRSAQPRPFLYATPDGALHSTTAQDESIEVRRSDSTGRAAVEDGLMGILIGICSGTAEDGQHMAEGLFSLEERVEALYAVARLTHSAGSDWESNNVGAGEIEGGGILGIIRKIDLLQIATAVCDLLGQVTERMAAKDGEMESVEEGDSLLRTFVSIASAVALLLGCREPMHWRDEQGRESSKPNGTSDNDDENNDENDDEYISGAWKRRLFLSPTECERGCCLCCGANPLLYQFMMTALAEHGLWQQLWHRVALPFLPHDFDMGVKAEDSNQNETDMDDTHKDDCVHIIHNERSDHNDARSVRPTLGVRLTLKMMTLLLLRCPATGPDLMSILCAPAPSEEAQMDSAWRAYAPDRAALTVMERRVLYTLRRLSSFLVFRRVACYAANAMHVLLVRLLSLPALSDVDLRVVVEGLLFMPDISSSSALDLDSASSSSAPSVFARAVHALAFPLSLQHNEGDEQDNGEYDHAARGCAVCPNLVVPAALLSALLLLLLAHERDAMNGAVFAPLRALCAREGKRGLQSALAAGLARTHQVMLVLRAVSLADAKEMQSHVVPTTLRLETPLVTAFSHLVRPNAPAPAVMRRRHVAAEAWAETLTVRARGTMMIGSRQRKGATSFSCVVACPTRAVVAMGFTKSSSVANDRNGLGHTSPTPALSSPRVVQVYMRATSVEECPYNGNSANNNRSIVENSMQYANTTTTASAHMHNMSHTNLNTLNNSNNGNLIHSARILHAADELPPMMFGSEPIRPNDSNRAAHFSPASPSRMPRGAVDTFFVSGDGTEYTRVADHVPCTGVLQRSRIEYTASADLLIMAPDVQDAEWPQSAVIVACATLHGDEVQLCAQPPRRQMKTAQTRTLTKAKSIAVCSARRPTSSNAEPVLGAHDDARAKATVDAMEKEKGNASRGPSQTEEELDAELEDLDAYVAAIQPVPLLDIVLEQRDREAAELRDELSQARKSEAETQRQLQEAVAQRDELRRCLMDARLEVDLCHVDIIAPLRREVTQLRKSLTLRNQEMRASLLLCRKLRVENARFADNIQDIRKELESAVTMNLNSQESCSFDDLE